MRVNYNKISVFSAFVFVQVAVLKPIFYFKAFDFLLLILFIKEVPVFFRSQSKVIVSFFCLLVLLPILSAPIYFTSIDAAEFKLYFGDADSVRSDPLINFAVTILQSLFSFLAIYLFSVYFQTAESSNVFRRYFVNFGILVALYSIYSSIFVFFLGFPDIIPNFMDARNTDPNLSWRPAGFVDEPGINVFVVWGFFLFFWFFRSHYGRLVRCFLTFIFLLAAFSTGSTLILFLLLFFVFSLIFIEREYLMGITFICFSALLLALLIYQGAGGLLYYLLIAKLQNFLQPVTDTLDSGAFRRFTNQLGFYVFMDYPLTGVGWGGAKYHLFQHIEKFEIVNWGEKLNENHSPQSALFKMLSEGGLISLCFLVHIFYMAFKNLYSNGCRRNRSVRFLFYNCFFMTVLSLLVVQPIFSSFLWLPFLGSFFLIRRMGSFSPKVRGFHRLC
jgi:hypothetical protein